MSYWRDDPEGMDERIVEAMKELGHSRENDDDLDILEKFNNDRVFGKTEDWLKVASLADGNYIQNLVGAAEARMGE